MCVEQASRAILVRSCLGNWCAVVLEIGAPLSWLLQLRALYLELDWCRWLRRWVLVDVGAGE